MSGSGLDLTSLATPDLQTLVLRVVDALRAGDQPRAAQLADHAALLGVDDADILTLAGQWRMQSGRFADAQKALVRARQLNPDMVETLDTLGLCLTYQGKAQEAVAVMDDALAKVPGHPLLLLHRAHPLEDIGRLSDAQADLEAALAVQPDNLAVLERAANLAARRGRMDAARDYANRALKLAPSPSAMIALAGAELADGNYQAASALMEGLANDPASDAVNVSIACGLLGDALEGLGREVDAFAAYTRGREIMRETVAPAFQTQDSAIGRVERATDYFRGADAADWRGPAYAAPVKTHAFLVGFPRSGTTLLEQALASHGDVASMEEVDCLAAAVGEYFYADDGLARFAALDEAALNALRARYWQAVDAAGIARDKPVFLDKMPLNSVHQGFIARLFPDAKILFALRDPRDVVLSCFRRRLVMTSNSFELARLDGAARFYDAVMTLSQVYRDLLTLQRLDVRHEDMVTDFDSEMHKACAFLDLDFQDGMRDFAARSQARDVKTPSAAQLVKGLNKDGVGQWRRYGAQMADVLPVLAPWAARFGYEAA